MKPYDLVSAEKGRFYMYKWLGKEKTLTFLPFLGNRQIHPSRGNNNLRNIAKLILVVERTTERMKNYIITHNSPYSMILLTPEMFILRMVVNF